ncbi:CHASE2 domain-containing protein [Methylococcus sp. Mc7]|uniref:CHASE2 domain-containing protein n=1 Tax=Methylococcus sp. Mc7 TaxID=2860258 RepID=UPI001C530791|nr:CHASE2 domain-containing protein [Methylococcus sp. Mc7]QXP83202.1 CHASE2 domain-containing protein [Methylococcus sp. Mc7]
MSAAGRTGETPSRAVLAAGCLLTGLALLLRLAGWAPWAGFDGAIFDQLVRMRLAARAESQVVVVDIDENTLSAAGQWPWPRYRVAALVKAIASAKPRAIGLDILFPEPDRTSLSTLRESFRREFGLELGFSGVPPGMEDNDGYLGAVLAASGTIGSIYFPPDLRDTGPRCPLAPLAISGARPAIVPPEGKSVLCNTFPVHSGLAGHGFINAVTDPDGRLRRQPMLYAYEGRWYPSLSLALLMRITGADAVEVGTDAFGPVLKLGRLAVPVDRQGVALLRFRVAGHAQRRVSALDILREDYSPQDLAGRIVLVGSSAVGLGDLHRTAVAPDLSGAEAHAVLIDGALGGVNYREPPWQEVFVSGTILASGLATALLFARLPALQATYGVVALVSALVGFGVGMFTGAGVALDFASPVLTVVVEAGVLSFLLYRRQERIAAVSRRAREAAEAASRAKSEFLARMSHEIRTPLHGMLSAVELLLHGGLDAGQREYAEIIRGSGRTLLAMLDDILDLSKIEAGKLELGSTEFELREVVDAAVGLFRAQALSRNLALRCDVEPGVPYRVKGDPGALRQVLANLIGNAVKFTARGEVALEVSLGQETPEATTLRFTVSDTGIGIPADCRDRIFSPFEQADGSTTRKYGGTGLGLAISRKLATLMGGECGVDSTDGEGSRFWFTAVFGKTHGIRGNGQAPSGSTGAAVPAGQGGHLAGARGLAPKPGPATSGISLTPRRPYRILVADDSPVNRKLLLAILERLGYAADAVGDGRVCLRVLGERRYDLVLMDCLMPEMDGYEATRLIRAGKSGAPDPAIPVIALTASAVAGDQEKCILAGMDGYLAKPVDIELLGQMLESRLPARI